MKSKLEGLESAYHDMMLRVQRLQSNRVCLGLLTGCDYPGERHPHNCPCADQRVKEEKVDSYSSNLNFTAFILLPAPTGSQEEGGQEVGGGGQ